MGFDTHIAATVTFFLVGVGGVMGFSLAYVAWRRGETPSSRQYAGLMAASGVWCALYAFVLGSPSFRLATWVYPLITATMIVTAIQWLRFSAEYTGYADRIPRVVWGLLWAETAGYVALVATNQYHGLLFTDVDPASFGPLLLVDATMTPLVWVQIGVVYAAVTAGLLLLVAFAARARPPFRSQAAAIGVGSLVVMLGNVLYLVGVSLHPDLDLTPIFFVGNGVVIWWALFHYDFLRDAPFASDALVDGMGDPVVLVDDDDVVLDHNPAATEVFEVDAEEVTGQPLDAVVPGLVSAIDADGPFVTRADDGSLRQYDPSSAPFHDHHDRYRGRLLVLRDITVQKRREATLAALQSATREFIDAEDERHVVDVAVGTADDVLDYAYSGVLRYDPDDDVLRAAALTDELADTVDDEFVVPRGEGPTWEVFETDEPRVYEADELDHMWHDGLPVEQLLVVPLGEYGVLGVGAPSRRHQHTDDDVRFVELLGTATETALDRLERERALRESQACLERRNRQMEFFNGVLRHDVLNGLTVVSGNADLLADHVDDDGDLYRRRIAEWAEDMTTLVERVRSTLDAVADEEALEPVDISTVLEEKAEKLRTTYDAVDVTVDVPSGLEVHADELLGEVVENVCMNAVEYNETDEPRVRLTATASDDGVVVRVADDGPGIPDELDGPVFDRDVTSDPTDTLGFGLYFVKVMMDRYGGDVRFEDNDPRGTVAVLEFPQSGADPDGTERPTFDAVDADDPEQSGWLAHDDSRPPASSDGTVLVVDDETAVTDLYESLLREYDTTTANSGSEALDVLTEDGDRIDVVLLDRRMPGMTGDEVLEEIRERDVDCRVAMLTAVAPDTDIVDMAFDDYVTKPTTGEEIRETVDSLRERAEYADKLDRYYTLATKYALLTDEQPRKTLADADEMASLETELRALERELGESVHFDDHQEFQYVLREVAD